ncbi:hypothetical protein [Rhizobium sp. BR 362]|uniref:hypothetical protein n=1 Tax=Rhizobium sp. BR 362 TaxID=3040670 RepID=UPI002F40CE51
MRLSLSVPEIVRVPVLSIESAIAHIIAELNGSAGGFNYIDATKRIKVAYKGLHNLNDLVRVAPSMAEKVGQKYNIDVVKLAAPEAFGRKTNVFDLHSRRFHYGGERDASYRAPFLFTENGIVKLYYLQPRKTALFTIEQASCYASIIKKFLLDTEFYGEKTDIEIVDVAERIEGQGRVTQTFTLANVEVWEDDKIAAHLKVVREALDHIEAENLVKRKRRPLKDSDLPLFY